MAEPENNLWNLLCKRHRFSNYTIVKYISDYPSIWFKKWPFISLLTAYFAETANNFEPGAYDTCAESVFILKFEDS